MKSIDALILCGGRGTRLHSVIPHTLEVLAPINGQPFLSDILDQLSITGFRDVIPCTGFDG